LQIDSSAYDAETKEIIDRYNKVADAVNKMDAVIAKGYEDYADHMANAKQLAADVADK